MPAPALPATVTSFHGLGFDACAAPGTRVMRAWRRHSPYRAIGIYIGGADRACAQPNLTSAWVRTQARAGWRFIPLYAGPQAAFGELRAPVRQATAAAADAAAQARDLDFGPRTPIYYDMEGFRRRSRVAVLKFVSAWTSELHRFGYESGVYSSSDSGIADLSRQYGRRIYAMPNIIYDALWDNLATTRDRHLHRGQWHHLRIHQFAGNVTQRYGGHTINLDKDYLDVRVRSPRGTAQETPAVALPDGSVDLFALRGGRLWLHRYSRSRGWARSVRTGAVASSAPAVVWTGSAIEVFYKGAGGYLWADSYQPDGNLAARHELPALGRPGSGPTAVASGEGIDVFWRGSLDDHLWHAQYLPGTGWAGPQGLGGDLASAPSPVASSPGSTAVFWKGTDGSLWRTTRGLRGRWTKPLRLGMGSLGGAPRATAQPDGGIEVYWAGARDQHLWEGFYRPRLGWRGPRDLGGQVRSAPWPVAGAGTVRVIWRGSAHQLTAISHRPGDGWNAAGWDPPVTVRVGWLGSAPFAAAGDPRAAVWAFWQDRHGWLWAVSGAGNRWGTPRMLAG